MQHPKRRRPIPANARIGLRFQHHTAVAEARLDVAWLDIHTEAYMGGGRLIACLEAIRANYPISLHGVGLSLSVRLAAARGRDFPASEAPRSS